MKSERKFKSFEETAGFIQTMCDSYSVVFGQPFISSDGKISVDQMTSIHNECIAYENEDPEQNFCPYTFWFGIRTRGVEAATNKEHVQKRVAELGDVTLCAIKVERVGDDFTVSYRQRPLISAE